MFKYVHPTTMEVAKHILNSSVLIIVNMFLFLIDGSGLNTSFQSVEGVQGGISRSFSHTEVQVSSLVTVSYKAKSFRKRLTPNLLVTKRKRNQLDDKGAREQGDTGSDSHDAGERERSASLEQVDTGSDSHDAVENSVSLEQVDTGSDDSVTEERPVPLEPIEFESDCGGECTLSQHEVQTTCMSACFTDYQSVL